MTLLEYLQVLSVENEKSAINSAITGFIDNHENVLNEEELEEKLRDFIVHIPETSYTAFGSWLEYCRTYCQTEQASEEQENTANSDTNYLQKILETLKLLNKVSTVYHQITIERKKNESKTESSADVNANLAQHRDVSKEILEDLRTQRADIERTKEEIKIINAAIDSKINDLLINTVAILGIFVAIAFVGIGVTSLFSSIDLKTALQSEEAFVKNITYLLLVASFSYNLLLLLVYFLFKLSRPLRSYVESNGKKESEEKEVSEEFSSARFTQHIKLRPFIIIDIVLCSLTIIVIGICIALW